MPEPEQTHPGNAPAARGFGMQRGERWIASLGLGMAAMLGLVAALGAGWSLWYSGQTAEEAHRAEVETRGQILADAAAAMAESGDLSGLRQLASVTALRSGLEDLTIRLGDGTIIASTDAARIQTLAPPPQWPELSAELASSGAGLGQGGIVRVSIVAVAPSRGPLIVEVVDAPPPSEHAATLAAGVLASAGLSLVGALWVYRSARKRLRAIIALRDALVAYQSGERDRSALELGAGLGLEATAWNDLLAQLDRASDAPAPNEPAARPAEMATGDFRPVCDAMWHGLVVVDDSGVVMYANGAAGILLGRPREELTCAALSEVVDSPELAEAVGQASTGETRQRVSLEIRRGDGAGVLRATVRSLRKGDTPSAVVLIEDITQQRLASEARDGFVAQAAHELRTPLTNIRLYAEEAIEFGSDDPQVRTRALNVINTEARRLERIVGNMLSVAEMEAGAPRLAMGEVRLEAMVAELEADYAAQAQDKRIALRFDLPPKYPVVFADRDKLMLALHNVVGNALKYTPEGGAVAVRLDADERQITVDVTDNGLGIAAEEHEKIFDRFYRSTDKRISGVKGSGLGLAMARQVARLHGGDITLKSEMNKGSTFTITVPTHARAA